MSYERYKYAKTKQNSKGKRVYSTYLYPSIDVPYPEDILIVAMETDRLDLLASKYYGDSTMWWIIAQANKIQGTMFPTPGVQLIIPMNMSYIESSLQEINL